MFRGAGQGWLSSELPGARAEDTKAANGSAPAPAATDGSAPEAAASDAAGTADAADAKPVEGEAVQALGSFADKVAAQVDGKPEPKGPVELEDSDDEMEVSGPCGVRCLVGQWCHGRDAVAAQHAE